MRVRYSQEGLFNRIRMAVNDFLYLDDEAFNRYCNIEDEL